MLNSLKHFLNSSLTSYHACENAKALLLEQGFSPLPETEDWDLCEGGKYFVERCGNALIAFTIDSLDDFSYKIIASHLDSPALKIKENPLQQLSPYVKLNTERYGGGIMYTFFDRPLKIAGRVVKCVDDVLRAETFTSDYQVSIPSLAIHLNTGVNDGFSVNAQTDLQPLIALSQEDIPLADILQESPDEPILSYDLFLVNADMPYSFGVNNEFLASPRIDNLTSVCASLTALLQEGERKGICVAAFFDNEEVGSISAEGAESNFLENVLRRIAYALRFDDNEYYKAMASSFLVSADNAHAMHPNHPEKSDPTNKTLLGGGVVIKSHANKAYVTDALSSALLKTIFTRAGVKYQYFFNRSDFRSGSTLGVSAVKRLGLLGADIGLAQLAMHSACESFAVEDYVQMVNGLTAFYQTEFTITNGQISIK